MKRVKLLHIKSPLNDDLKVTGLRIWFSIIIYLNGLGLGLRIWITITKFY